MKNTNSIWDDKGILEGPIGKWIIAPCFYVFLAVGIYFYIGEDTRGRIADLVIFKLTATPEQKAERKVQQAQERAKDELERKKIRVNYAEEEIATLVSAERTGTIIDGEGNEYNVSKNGIDKLWKELRKDFADVLARYSEKDFRMMARLAYVEEQVADLIQMEKTGKMWSGDENTLTKEDIKGFWDDLKKEYPDVFANYEEMQATREVYRERLKKEGKE